jgi:hypothetical protein
MISTAPYLMLLMRANPLRGQAGNGLGPGNQDFFGPREIAFSLQASAIWDLTPSHLPKMWICPHQKYLQGRINQRSIGSFMYMSFQGPLLGFGRE